MNVCVPFSHGTQLEKVYLPLLVLVQRDFSHFAVPFAFLLSFAWRDGKSAAHLNVQVDVFLLP
jgi:hypothetical protein